MSVIKFRETAEEFITREAARAERHRVLFAPIRTPSLAMTVHASMSRYGAGSSYEYTSAMPGGPRFINSGRIVRRIAGGVRYVGLQGAE